MYKLDADELKRNLKKLCRSEDIISVLESFSTQERLNLADKALISFLQNERFFESILSKENTDLPQKGIKNKYAIFNAEHVMGYESKKTKGKITYKSIPPTPFRICDASEIDIEDWKNSGNQFLVYCKKKNIKINYENKYKQYDVLSSSSNRSKYLYSRADKSIYFLGQPPKVFIKNLSDFSSINDEELDNLMQEPQKINLVIDEKDSFDRISLLTFGDAIKQLMDSISHDKILFSKNYIAVAWSRASSRTIVFDKGWLKAICEIVIKSKPSTMSEIEIYEKLKELRSKNPKSELKINSPEETSIKSFIQKNFIIDENTLNFLLSRAFDTTGSSGKNFVKSDQSLQKIATLIHLYQPTFEADNFLPYSAKLPSKIFFYFLSIVGDAEQDIIDGSAEKTELVEEFNNKLIEIYHKTSKSLKDFPVLKNHHLKVLNEKLINLIEEYDLKLALKDSYFSYNYIASIFDTLDYQGITAELIASMCLMSNSDRINELDYLTFLGDEYPTKERNRQISECNQNVSRIFTRTYPNLIKNLLTVYEFKKDKFNFADEKLRRIIYFLRTAIAHQDIYFTCLPNRNLEFSFVKSISSKTTNDITYGKIKEHESEPDYRVRISLAGLDYLAEEIYDAVKFGNLNNPIPPSQPDKYNKSTYFKPEISFNRTIEKPDVSLYDFVEPTITPQGTKKRSFDSAHNGILFTSESKPYFHKIDPYK